MRGASTSEPARTRVELELELGAEPIRGAIRDPDGAESSFTGWLELIGALERIAGSQASASGKEAGRGERD